MPSVFSSSSAKSGVATSAPPPQQGETKLSPKGESAPRCAPRIRHADLSRLKHTGKKALVVYGVTHRSSGAVFDVEMDNLDFFARQGLLPAGLKTALFTQVDFAFQRVVLDKGHTTDSVKACPIRKGDHVADHAFDNEHNVRTFHQPKGPCDLCALSRMLRHLGIEAAGSDYAFIISLNSGARGPFFTVVDNTGPAPFTWVDHFALGGEAQFSGNVVTTNAASIQLQPHIQTYAFGLPSAALRVVMPLLSSACPLRKKSFCINKVEIKVAEAIWNSSASSVGYSGRELRIRSLLHSHNVSFGTAARLEAFAVKTGIVDPFRLKRAVPCDVVFAKYGGEMWRKSLLLPQYIADVVAQTAGQKVLEPAFPRGSLARTEDIREAVYGQC